MLSKRFWVFQKISFIKESVEQSQNKKRVKSVLIKYVSYESLSSINLAYDSFTLELWYEHFIVISTVMWR